MEKQSYDKAVDEIKNVFNLLRIQLQKIQETMSKIRRNALNYTVADYEAILSENIEAVDEAKGKFAGYREMVKTRVHELEEENINVRKLNASEEEKLQNLRVIETYLNRSIDELQKILSSHFDLKALYTKELEALSQMSLIKRFSLRNELYDKILENPAGLEHLMIFLRPLFQRDVDKIYNLNKALEFQRPMRKNREEDLAEELDFDEESWQEEQERKRRDKLKLYEGCLGSLLDAALAKGQVTLAQICEDIASDEGERKRLLPNVEIFKEVMVELIRNREMDMDALRKERSENIVENAGDFQLNAMLLDLVDGSPKRSGIRKIEVMRVEDGQAVVFEQVEDAGQVLSQLTTTILSYEKLMEKLEVDISLVEKEKTKIVELLEDYLQEVHRNLGRIDHNSTITIREKPVKMLKIQLPDWEENLGMYQVRLNDFIDDLTQKGIEIFEKNENAQEYFGARLTTRNLYDQVVGIANVQIRLYKVEEQREYPITWAEVAKNSGGEGFLSAFIILTSLLYYMRKDESDIFADRNEGKVLLMDNPFAQTNAAHLLKPLMDMAKKTNTQLICLSGLGGDSIYNRFDNIYVLNLIAASLRGGTQYLKANHTRGSEPETMILSRIEVMEQQELIF